MNATTIHETELMTRSIARWGSVVAAIIFGVAFATDPTLSWHIVSKQIAQIMLISVIFLGYALAWTKRFEVLGSSIALLAMIAVYSVMISTGGSPALVFLAVGAPAAFHLLAVILHRYALPRMKKIEKS